MEHYPVYLSLRYKRVLVVGTGGMRLGQTAAFDEDARAD